MNGPKNNAFVLVAVILMDLLAGMELDLFVPSFPELQDHFALSPFLVEGLLSINFAGYCLSMIFVGRWGDVYGRKPVILAGLLIFIIGSLLCLYAPSYSVLFIGRFLQGIGVAAPAILSFLIISDRYPIKQQQSLFGILNGVMNAAVGIAPVLGSYITLYFHWQGNFFTLLVLGVLTLLITQMVIPADKKHHRQESLPPKETCATLKSKPIILGIIHFICNFVPYWIFVGMSPILYLEGLGVSLKYFGYYQGSLAFTFAIGSFLFGFVVAKYSQVKMLYLSILIFVLSLIGIGAVAALKGSSALAITLVFIPFVIGQIAPSIILYPLLLNYKPEAKARIASILQGGRLIFSALSLQVAGYFYQGSFQNIALLLMLFIAMTAITLYLVIQNRTLLLTNENPLYKKII